MQLCSQDGIFTRQWLHVKTAKASFDLSVAAQHQEPSADDVKTLNKRLNWQIANKSRGIRYIPIQLATAKLYVFVDGSFAKNKDLSSQLGYTIILANELKSDNDEASRWYWRNRRQFNAQAWSLFWIISQFTVVCGQHIFLYVTPDYWSNPVILYWWSQWLHRHQLRD